VVVIDLILVSLTSVLKPLTCFLRDIPIALSRVSLTGFSVTLSGLSVTNILQTLTLLHQGSAVPLHLCTMILSNLSSILSRPNTACVLG
jgi:hypothetical protein